MVKGPVGLSWVSAMKLHEVWKKKSQFVYIISQKVSLLVDSILVSGNGRGTITSSLELNIFFPKEDPQLSMSTYLLY